MIAEVNRCLVTAAAEPSASCTHDGVVYGPGESFDSAGGCSACVCYDGQWRCSTPDCDEDVCAGEACPDAPVCVSQGESYRPGERYLVNTEYACTGCTCIEGDLEHCEPVLCPEPPPREPLCFGSVLASGMCAEDEVCEYASESYDPAFVTPYWNRTGLEQQGIVDTAQGYCVSRPDEPCEDNDGPVCGCDNATYDSMCDAMARGVPVAYRGTCDADPNNLMLYIHHCTLPSAGWEADPGTTSCTYNGKFFKVGSSFKADGSCENCACLPDGSVACMTVDPCFLRCSASTATIVCGSDRYCDVELYPAEDVRIVAIDYECEPRPEMCDDADVPVCGCDRQTYRNECVANLNGITVGHRQACGTDPDRVDSFHAACSCYPEADRPDCRIATRQLCGGQPGLTCPPGEFCDYAGEDRCGAGGAFGRCALLPYEPCAPEVTPVCGCDGLRYDNACKAHAAGVAVAAGADC